MGGRGGHGGSQVMGLGAGLVRNRRSWMFCSGCISFMRVAASAQGYGILSQCQAGRPRGGTVTARSFDTAIMCRDLPSCACLYPTIVRAQPNARNLSPQGRQGWSLQEYNWVHWGHRGGLWSPRQEAIDQKQIYDALQLEVEGNGTHAWAWCFLAHAPPKWTGQDWEIPI